jgi:hypothetical protein
VYTHTHSQYGVITYGEYGVIVYGEYVVHGIRVMARRERRVHRRNRKGAFLIV